MLYGQGRAHKPPICPIKPRKRYPNTGQFYFARILRADPPRCTISSRQYARATLADSISHDIYLRRPPNIPFPRYAVMACFYCVRGVALAFTRPWKRLLRPAAAGITRAIVRRRSIAAVSRPAKFPGTRLGEGKNRKLLAERGRVLGSVARVHR